MEWRTASSFGAGMLVTEERWENVACKAVVDFVISHNANELFLSPTSSVCNVTTASALPEV